MVSVAKQWRRPIKASGGQEAEKQRSKRSRKGKLLLRMHPYSILRMSHEMTKIGAWSMYKVRTRQGNQR